MFLKLIKAEKSPCDINIETARHIAGEIKKRYPYAAIYITGSVLNPDLIHPGSDIDIVIEGVKDEEFVSLVKSIHRQFPSVKIDMRRMEDMDSYTRGKVIERGLLVQDDK